VSFRVTKKMDIDKIDIYHGETMVDTMNIAVSQEMQYQQYRKRLQDVQAIQADNSYRPVKAGFVPTAY
jgi:hypothetical protein